MRVERITLPSLHFNQQKIFDEVAVKGTRNVVAVCGRRFGKSDLALDLIVEYAVNRGLKVWWVVPTNKVADEHWFMLKTMLEPKGRKPIYTSKNEVARTLRFIYPNTDGTKSSGFITFRSAEKAGSLRGGGLDLIVFDEAAYIDEIIYKTLKPSTTDRKGQFLFLSTPNIIQPLNWFYGLYNLCLEDDPEWKHFHFTSYDNPFLDPKEIDSAKKVYTDVEFNIEYLAKFEDTEGRVFRNIEKLATVDMEIPRPSGVYAVGIDFGRKNDYTAISIIDLQHRKQVYLERFSKTAWTLQGQRIREINRRWHPIVIWAEENSAQILLEDLQREGLPIKTFYTSAQTKAPLIEALSIAFDKEAIQILSDESPEGKIQLGELKVYEMRPNRAGMSWSYNAPKGYHDDTVIALALAYQAIQLAPDKVTVNSNPFYKAHKPQGILPRSSIFDRLRKKRPEVDKDILEQLMKEGVL